MKTIGLHGILRKIAIFAVLMLLVSGLACRYTVRPEETLVETPEDLLSTEVIVTEPTELSPTAASREETGNSVPEDPADSPGGEEYWDVIEDTHHQVRFAVPCFWEVGFIDPPPPTDAYAYHLRNYTEEFSMSFGKNTDAVWESGGIKIDMNFLSGADWNLADDASPEDLLAVLFHEGSGSKLLAVEEVVINNQEGRLVTIESSFDGEHQYVLFKAQGSLFLIFAPINDTLEHPDVQAILNSLALTPDVEVAVPTIVPAASPDSRITDCLTRQ